MEATGSVEFLASLAEAMSARPPKRKLLVAVSGGRDSVALLHGLLELGYRKLVIVHLDHRLRGRVSTADAKFVAALGRSNNLPVVLGKSETRAYAADRGVSLELAARELRQTLFVAAARRHRCRHVLLAHHADDQIETCLFHFLRGSGSAGLAGMRVESELTLGRTRLTLVRPLLAIRRSVIDAFVASRKLRFREDASNAKVTATRNRLRHQLLPVIAETFGESFADAILRNARIFAAEEDFLRGTLDQIPLVDQLSVRELRAYPLALRRRVVGRWLRTHGVPEVGFAEVERVLGLIRPDATAAKVNLPGAAHARRRAGRLFLELNAG